MMRVLHRFLDDRPPAPGRRTRLGAGLLRRSAVKRSALLGRGPAGRRRRCLRERQRSSPRPTGETLPVCHDCTSLTVARRTRRPGAARARPSSPGPGQRHRPKHPAAERAGVPRLRANNQCPSAQSPAPTATACSAPSRRSGRGAAAPSARPRRAAACRPPPSPGCSVVAEAVLYATGGRRLAVEHGQPLTEQAATLVQQLVDDVDQGAEARPATSAASPSPAGRTRSRRPSRPPTHLPARHLVLAARLVADRLNPGGWIVTAGDYE